MGYKWIYSTFARLTVLAAGVSLLTVGILKENWWVGIVGGILCVVMLFVSYWMQQQLRLDAAAVAREKLADVGSHSQSGLFIPSSAFWIFGG